MSRNDYKSGDVVQCMDEKDVHTRIECFEDAGIAFHVDWENLKIIIR